MDRYITTISIFLTLLASCTQYAQKEIFLIPEVFEGTVTIVFDQDNGVAQQYDSTNARIYEIPSDGVLLTKFERVHGVLNQHFFLIDSLGSTIREITPLMKSNQKKVDENDYVVFDMFDASTGKSMNDTDKSSPIRCIYFSVGKLRNRQILVKQSHSDMEKVLKRVRLN